MKLRLKPAYIIACAIGLVATSALALDLASVAHDRKANMKTMGGAMKAINEQLKSATPDLGIIKAQAAKLDAGAHLMADQFPEGSGLKVDPKSEALDTIWSDKAKFKQISDDYVKAASNLNIVAQAGNASALANAYHDVGQACKACHTQFKKRDEH